jgi:hypothetical protein
MAYFCLLKNSGHFVANNAQRVRDHNLQATLNQHIIILQIPLSIAIGAQCSLLFLILTTTYNNAYYLFLFI